MNKKIKWGILGTGYIANIFASAINDSDTCELYAIASRYQAKAEFFGRLHKVPKFFSSYQSLLSDENINAIYIALPHSIHAEWTEKSILAKKHVLCEKPLTINYAEALRVVNLARLNNVFLMEAFAFKSHPQTKKLVDLIKAREIGDIRVINATFSFNSELNQFDKEEIKNRGGGAVLDAGCYPISMITKLIGEYSGSILAVPDDICGVSFVDEDKIDQISICCLKFPNGIMAQVSCGISVDQDNSLRIYGSGGDILVKSPWIPGGRIPGVTEIMVNKKGSIQPHVLSIETLKSSTLLQIDQFAENISNKEIWGFVSNESLINMKILDRWRRFNKIIYKADF